MNGGLPNSPIDNLIQRMRSAGIQNDVLAVAQDVNDLLVPLGVETSVTTFNPNSYDHGYSIYWKCTVRARGQFWDGSEIDGYEPLHHTDDKVYSGSATRVAILILQQIHRRIMEPPPRALDVDYRPTEMIPEDFYSA